MRYLLISSLFILLFTGCLTKELPSYTTYSLKSNNNKVFSQETRINKSIFITQPKALNSLKTRNIPYSNGLEKNFYALSIWSDEPSQMIQQLLTNRLATSGTYSYVVSSKIKQITDYSLYSELISFEHNIQESNSYALLKIRVYLKDNLSSKIYSKTFDLKKKVTQNSAQSAVESLNMITNQFLTEVTLFIESSIQGDN